MSSLMGLSEGPACGRGEPGLTIGDLGPGDDPVVESTIVILADALFAEKFSGEAKVDGAGCVEALQVLCRQGQVDCFEVFF
jgi:hypothetical protein